MTSQLKDVVKRCYYVKHVYWKLFRHSQLFIWYTTYHIMIHNIFTHARKIGQSEKGNNSTAHILTFKYYIQLILEIHIKHVTSLI